MKVRKPPTTSNTNGAAPCAPNRGNHASAPPPAHDAVTADAPHAHPAGKSGAAGVANNTDPNAEALEGLRTFRAALKRFLRS